MYLSSLYETDFYAWTQEQVNLLKTQQWSQVDTPNLIEEIESLLILSSQQGYVSGKLKLAYPPSP